MKREFISLDIFNRLWENLGLSDDDLNELQEHLNLYPESGKIIPHTGGVRKSGGPLKEKGKVAESGFYILTSFFMKRYIC